MKIKYEFADGDVEVDVPNEWASILVELDRLERNNDKKERRRHYSLDSCVYEGIVYASEDKNLTAIFETDSKFGRLTEAIKYLSDKQEQWLLKRDYAPEDIVEYVNEDDPEIVEASQQSLGYFIAYKDMFSTWIHMGSDFSVDNVRTALSSFTRLISPSHKKVFDGIFNTLEAG